MGPLVVINIGGASAPKPYGFRRLCTVFRSTVVNDIGSLKTTVDTLKHDIQVLKGQLNSRSSAPNNDCDTCPLYVRFKFPTSETLNKALLESKLCTTILSYDIVRVLPTPAFRVIIGKSLLHNAIIHARTNKCIADIWGGTSESSLLRSASSSNATQSMASEQSVMKVTCWNCRGLSNSIPYLNHLMESGSDIMVLSEHWLWPYELHKLNEIHPDYEGLGRADARLTDSSGIAHRGCGGVGMVSKKSLDVTPMTDIESDRICGIRVKKLSGYDELWMSIIGVYLPCLDLGINLYRDTLINLERVISEYAHWGPVIIAGDFNAHLDRTWGPRAQDNPNLQGTLLAEVLQRCNLHVASLSKETHGPNHTYQSDIVPRP